MKKHIILIYGYGREGKSTEAYLHAHSHADKIVIYDAETHPTKPDFASCNQIWLSPGIPIEQIPEQYRHRVTTQADVFFSHLNNEDRQKVIAITGSKGKTSTTVALTHFLNTVGFNTESAGNIGTPLLEALPKLQHGIVDYLVVEISSFQAEHIRRSPHTVVFLNLFADHLDRHGNQENYLAAKANLWLHQEEGDHFIVPEKTLTQLSEKLKKSAIGSPILPTHALPDRSILQAMHFRENLGVLPVVAQKLNLQFSTNQLHEALKTMPLPAHRLEYVQTINGLQFYDDAIAVNPTATMAAVNHFQTDLGYLILGGKSSGDDPTDLIRLIEEITPTTKLIITESDLSKQVKKIKTRLSIEYVVDLPAAFELLPKSNSVLKDETVILLSPAAKSYDQYKNFEEKGNHFKQLIAQLNN